MGGGAAETHKDDTPFATGTHKNATAAVLSDPGADFKSCGVATGVLIKNTTDGSSGTITAVTEDFVTGTLSGGTLNTWTAGDTYEIYITATEDSVISSIWTDLRYGRKSDKIKLHRGLRAEDMDLDEFQEELPDPRIRPFGPGQPARK